MPGHTPIRADTQSRGGDEAISYASGTTYFSHLGWLGTERAWSGMGQANAGACGNLPFGDGTNCSSGSAIGPYHFTGQCHDNESGLDYFQARHYAASQARFVSPYPSGLAAVDPKNPQTWNRYAYVGGNPLGEIDPLGLIAAVPPGCIGQTTPDPSTGEYYFCGYDLGQLPRRLQPWGDDGYTVGSGGRGGPTTEPPRGPSCKDGRAKFVEANFDAAVKIADKVDSGPSEILGLSAFESDFGRSNLAIKYGNFFGLTAGRNFTGTIGVYHSPNGYKYGIYGPPGFLNSGLSFANSTFGTRIRGITDPTIFAKELVGGSYNTEQLTVPYWRQLVDNITAVAAIVATCIR